MKDLIDHGCIELIYTHTDELVTNILTKPVNGWKFQYLLYKLLGWCNSKLEDQNLQIAEEVCWNMCATMGGMGVHREVEVKRHALAHREQHSARA